MGKKHLIVLFVVAVLFFVSGFATARIMYGKQKPADPADTRAAGWEAARERLLELGVVQKDEAEAPITDIIGDIEKVGQAEITVKIRPLELLADPDFDHRLVKIDSNTRIIQTTVKDAESYQAEMKAYREKLGDNYDRLVNTDDFPAPPSSYIEAEIAASSLEANKKVRITAGENIRNQKEFTALTITILPQ